MIGIVDYGVGNLYSLRSSLAYLGLEHKVSGDKDILGACDRIILPGVGAFGDAANKLKESRLDEFLINAAAEGKPLLGICLGMQLLMEESREFGIHKGLGLIPGKVMPLAPMLPQGFKVPHMGWNSLDFRRDDPLFRYNNEGDYVYFVHSYYGTDCDEYCIATADYGIPVTAAIRRGKVAGTQFHPEKSGDAGLKILRAFSEE